MWKAQSLSSAISLLLDYILRRKIRYVDRRGDFRMRDPAARDIEAVAQMRIIGERLLPALVGEREHEGQRGVVERIGRSARHRAGHVGDAVIDRKSTRLNSSHSQISYAVFCLKKKNITPARPAPNPPRQGAGRPTPNTWISTAT